MIRPDKLQELTTLTATDLVKLLTDTGYTDNRIRYSKFIGINRNTEFVYDVTYWDQDFEEWNEGSIFVKFNDTLLTTTADF